MARKIPIDPTHFIPGRTGSSKECWRKNDIVYEKAHATASNAKPFTLARANFRTLSHARIDHNPTALAQTSRKRFSA
jgi:hypothetical protein